MSFDDVALQIETAIKVAASKLKYNKSEFLAKFAGLSELDGIRKEFPNWFIEKIISPMLETDFCEIADVEDCEAGPRQACACTKVMVFGGDELNGKICEKFTVRVTSSKCKDGNLALAGPCVVSPLADFCDAPLTSKEEVSELREQLAHAQDQIRAMCAISGRCSKAYLASFGIDEL